MNDVEVLLAGLEVGSISELRRLVNAGRAGVVVTPNQREAIEGMHGGLPVRIRNAERDGFFVGGIHVERADDPDTLHAAVIAADVTPRGGGCLGISYDTLMTLPLRDGNHDEEGR